jgi:hypothetical protein
VSCVGAQRPRDALFSLVILQITLRFYRSPVPSPPKKPGNITATIFLMQLRKKSMSACILHGELSLASFVRPDSPDTAQRVEKIRSDLTHPGTVVTLPTIACYACLIFLGRKKLALLYFTLVMLPSLATLVLSHAPRLTIFEYHFLIGIYSLSKLPGFF